jgi:integrase
MLSWATTVRVPGGGRLLEYNPLLGVRRVRELNPKRPVATWERFHKTRVAIQMLQVATESEAERTRWTRIELALVLAEATGRRLGSIRQLRWEDIDFQRPTIRWRAEADKKRREWVIPVPASLLEELKQYRTDLPLEAIDRVWMQNLADEIKARPVYFVAEHSVKRVESDAAPKEAAKARTAPRAAE